MWIYFVGAVLSALGLRDLWSLYSKITEINQNYPQFITADDRFIINMTLVCIVLFGIFCTLCVTYIVSYALVQIRDRKSIRRVM